MNCFRLTNIPQTRCAVLTGRDETARIPREQRVDMTLMATVAPDRCLFLHVGDIDFAIASSAAQQNRIVLETVVHEDEISNGAIVMGQLDLCI